MAGTYGAGKIGIVAVKEPARAAVHLGFLSCGSLCGKSPPRTSGQRPALRRSWLSHFFYFKNSQISRAPTHCHRRTNPAPSPYQLPKIVVVLWSWLGRGLRFFSHTGLHLRRKKTSWNSLFFAGFWVKRRFRKIREDYGKFPPAVSEAWFNGIVCGWTAGQRALTRSLICLIIN